MQIKIPLVEITTPVNGIPQLLTYSLPEFFPTTQLIGRRALVLVGNRKVVGVIVNDQNVAFPENIKIKSVEALLDETPVVTKEQLDLCRFVSEYYLAPLGLTVRLCLPADTPKSLTKDFDISKLKKEKKKKLIEEEILTEKKQINLNHEQKDALELILHDEENAFLLQGVTGSGKTEIYIAAAKEVLLQNKSVLIIVPEIALTSQLVMRFRSQLNETLVTIHSGISKQKRIDAFKQLLEKKVRVVIGARSALFAPMPDLGLIVVDEEHDSSLKQDETPRYHARDVALWRAHHEKAKIILGSATPSLESILNVEKGKLKLLKLKSRIGAQGRMPHVEVIDLKERGLHKLHRKNDFARSDGQNLCILSVPLKEAIDQTLLKGEQVMLFLNRRGYAAFALCESCGYILQCKHCSVSMTYHQKQNLLRCHQCNETRSFCEICPECHEGQMLYFGLGTERVEKEVLECFPKARVARLDKDVARRYKKVKEILSEMQSGNIDVLIGTQMIAKGHDFKGVSLVGVILADTALAMPDFRASEKTFQLLTQVAGRAGRGEDVGKVLVQTFNPEHRSIVFSKKHDVDGFLNLEKNERKEMLLPPYVRAAVIRVESQNEKNAEMISLLIKDFLSQKIKELQLEKEVSILGPAPSPILRVRGKARWHIFFKSHTVQVRNRLLLSLWQNDFLYKEIKRFKAKVVLDIDPILML